MNANGVIKDGNRRIPRTELQNTLVLVFEVRK